MVKVVLLGIAQDGGRPQPGCNKSCCERVSLNEMSYPVSLGITDNDGTTHLIETSRHLGEQIRYIWKLPNNLGKKNRGIDNVWITHAHLGHIDGLGLFGRETMDARGINLHVSNSIANAITHTPSWNIMKEQKVFKIIENFDSSKQSSTLAIEAIPVPHRAELTDMHAFIIRGVQKSLLFLPDHDTWEKTLAHHSCYDIRSFLKKFKVDIALIDGTFWSTKELDHQDVVPHPPVIQSLQMLGPYVPGEDPEIYFTHLNHTNPLFNTNSIEYQAVYGLGWSVAQQGMVFNI
jgi:pyrroloquinoline quinone biosynthesis protein B